MVHVEGCQSSTGFTHLHAAHLRPAPPCPACAAGPAFGAMPEEGPALARLAATVEKVAYGTIPLGADEALQRTARGPPTLSGA